MKAKLQRRLAVCLLVMVIGSLLAASPASAARRRSRTAKKATVQRTCPDLGSSNLEGWQLGATS